ncbi:DUF4345 domain-containing protein [Streptomyces sp. URMC 123]|uniref:DUF4345 domain-containing protein n=1 Tax=Streptomyces sp. URMC 123 TaxID=3423403 RepID=UPI003F1BDFEE
MLAVLSLIPIGTGLMDAFAGVNALPSEQVANADLESNYRFLATIWLGVGVLILWIIPRVETALLPFRAVCAVTVAGGLVRLLSMAVAGVPHTMFVWAFVLELVAPPLLALWQTRVARAVGRRPGAVHPPGAVHRPSAGRP